MATVKFNGVDLTDLFIVGEQQRPLPEFRVSTTEVGGVDGAVFDGLTIGMRECSFVVSAVDVSRRGLQRAARTLMEALSVREPKKLVFSDEKDPNGNQLRRLAVPSGAFDAREFVRAGQWTCKFVQPDPYLYGMDHYEVIKRGKDKEIAVGGNAPAWWTAEATPSASPLDYYAIGATGLWMVQFNAPFNGKRTIALNARRGTVKLSPAVDSAAGLHTDSRFEPIEGKVVLSATHNTDFEWTERWL